MQDDVEVEALECQLKGTRKPRLQKATIDMDKTCLIQCEDGTILDSHSPTSNFYENMPEPMGTLSL